MSNDTQPEIRFPGFTEAWEERKVGEIFKVTRGQVLAATETSESITEKNIYPVYSSQTKNDGLMGYYSDYLFDTAITWTTDGANAGTVNYRNGKFYSTNVNGVLLSDKGYANKAVAEIINRIAWKHVSKVGNPKLMNNVMSEITITIPSVEEQETISRFFTQLDSTITLHERELDLLKETKKGFLQKMFPKNGAKVPEVRFPGFTGDWEERKLGEVVVFLNGRAFKQQELLDSGKYRVLRVGNFNTNDRWYYSNLELEEDKYANKGDLLYLWATSFGPEMWNEERVIYHYHIWKLKFLSKELDKQYLYTWLLTDKEKIKESTNGTTMVHVTKGGIEQRTFQFPPDINEQQKIGAFFKQLDDTIALHQRKLDLLKETKKGFLQKMFV